MTMIETLPKVLLARAPAMDEFQAVYDVMYASGTADYGEETFTLEDLRLIWHEPGFNLAEDAWVVVTPEHRIVAYADTGHRNHVKLFGDYRVHPEYRGLGIEKYLVQLIESRMRQHIVQAPSHARITLAFRASPANKADAALLEQEGYAHIRSFYEMAIDLLEAPPAPIWPVGVTVRTMQPGEERAVFELIDEAFSDHWGHLPGVYEEWKHWQLGREQFDPALFFLAYDGDQLAGGSLCQYEPAYDAGWVGQLAVRRSWRRKGLGLALLLHSFGEFYRRGVRKVLLGVDSQNLTGALRLYKRAGMHVMTQTHSYEKELRPGEELSTQVIRE